jgi:hypothetical protein
MLPQTGPGQQITTEGGLAGAMGRHGIQRESEGQGGGGGGEKGAHSMLLPFRSR